MNKEDIFTSIFAIVITISFLILLVESTNNLKAIKSGELIIINNSSYKCKMINTLEEK